MSKEDADRSSRSFWSFLRIKKKPSPASEKAKVRRSGPSAWEISEETEIWKPEAPEEESSEETEVLKPETTEKESSEEPEAWEEPESVEKKSSEEAETEKPETLEKKPLKEAEAWGPEVLEGEPSEEAETREPEESALGAGGTVEELRTLEKQVACLESCIAERLNQRVEAASAVSASKLTGK